MPPPFFRGLAALLAACGLLIYFIPSAVVHAAEQERPEPPAQPQVEAGSAYLMDRRTGTVLYQMNADQAMYPASITKIITGIVALESGTDLSGMVTISKEARHEDGTRVYLAEGEQQTLDDLIQAMLINSGNDAATAVAEYIDGSKEKFAERMNAFIQEKIGVHNSHFTNPHGLPDELQYTTAADMAHIAQYAMANEKFRSIVGTKKRPWSGAEWTSDLENHNQLLGRYEGTTGVKNGFTNASGYTLVASAERDGMELIGVLLKAPSVKQLYLDMEKLLDYGFAGFEPKQLFDKGETYTRYAAAHSLEYTAEEPIWAVLPKGETPRLQIDDLGTLSVISSLGIVEAGHMQPLPLPAEESADRTGDSAASQEGAGDQRSSDVLSWLKVFAWMVLALIFAWIGYLRWQRKRRSGF